MDWKNEKKTLTEGGTYFKAVEGKHIIKILNEGKIVSGKWPDGTEKEQYEMEIEIDGQKKTWALNKKSTSTRSLWGQFVAFATDVNGEIVGKTLTLKVVGTGKSTNYMIV